VKLSVKHVFCPLTLLAIAMIRSSNATMIEQGVATEVFPSARTAEYYLRTNLGELIAILPRVTSTTVPTQ